MQRNNSKKVRPFLLEGEVLSTNISLAAGKVLQKDDVFQGDSLPYMLNIFMAPWFFESFITMAIFRWRSFLDSEETLDDAYTLARLFLIGTGFFADDVSDREREDLITFMIMTAAEVSKTSGLGKGQRS